MEKPKLTITKIDDADCYGLTIRITNKADALLDVLAKKSGRTKRYIASKMIEFAFDYTEVDGVENTEESE